MGGAPMTPFPLGLDPPGKRLTSSLQDRSALRLLAIVAEHHLRGFARYTPRDVDGDGHPDTWCNLFAQDVAEACGVLLPRHTRANQLMLWLMQESHEHGWEQAGAHVAQRMADEGQLAVGVWFNRQGPGHIAVLVPSLGEAGTWIAQAGATRFTRAPVESGFGARPVTYFVHP